MFKTMISETSSQIKNIMFTNQKFFEIEKKLADLISATALAKFSPDCLLCSYDETLKNLLLGNGINVRDENNRRFLIEESDYLCVIADLHVHIMKNLIAELDVKAANEVMANYLQNITLSDC